VASGWESGRETTRGAAAGVAERGRAREEKERVVAATLLKFSLHVGAAALPNARMRVVCMVGCGMRMLNDNEKNGQACTQIQSEQLRSVSQPGVRLRGSARGDDTNVRRRVIRIGDECEGDEENGGRFAMNVGGLCRIV